MSRAPIRRSSCSAICVTAWSAAASSCSVSSFWLLNFLDGLYKLARLNWHVAYQIAMTLLYVALSVRLIQLILAFRGE